MPNTTDWNLLSPKIGLEPYAKEFGHFLRDAIKGTRGNGTIVIEVFNQHQSRVFDQMAGKGSGAADFEQLRTELVRRLEIGAKSIDDSTYPIEQRDAVSYAAIIHGTTIKLFKRLDAGLKPADAERVKTVLTSLIMDVGQMAESELEAGIAEWAVSRRSTVSN